VDISSIGLARDPEALRRIARQTGMNVVMGSGYYIGAAQPPEARDMTVDQLAALIVAELRTGVGTTGIRPGVIGEIGLTDIANASDLRHLRAGARAQRETGAPLYIHPPHREKGQAILDIVEAEGGVLAKTVLCHCGQTPDSPEYYHGIARRGAYIGFDQFGVNLVAGGLFLPCDQERILQVKAQVERGNLERILISQDVCFKMCLVRYGGWGYGHILRNLLPFFHQAGMTSRQLDTLMIDNPARLLAW
jgi:phosphotriesterase-related protein